MVSKDLQGFYDCISLLDWSLIVRVFSFTFTYLFNVDIVFLEMALFCFSPQLGSERRPLLHYRGS